MPVKFKTRPEGNVGQKEIGERGMFQAKKKNSLCKGPQAGRKGPEKLPRCLRPSMSSAQYTGLHLEPKEMKCNENVPCAYQGI